MWVSGGRRVSAMLLASYFDYGTTDYPPKVARRLRATNITAALVTATMLAFQLQNLSSPDMLSLAAIAGYAAIPLLHRYGSAAAPLALVAFAWFHTTRIALAMGTGNGIYLAFLSAAPLTILLFGLERLWLAGLLSAASVALAAILHLFLPQETGMVRHSEMQFDFVLNFFLNAVVLFGVVAYVTRIAARAEATAEREQERSDRLLLNVLPQAVAERLKNSPDELIADRYEAASVLFADMAGFTERASGTEPVALVGFLNSVFRCFDTIVAAHGLEKIKTLGDGYMVVSGVPVPRTDHAEALAHVAIEMRDAARELRDAEGRRVSLRIGLATGPVVAGVIGTSKFFYDVWGDAVNMAARMEATGLPGRIHVAPAAAQALMRQFDLTSRGQIEIKGKGHVETWFLEKHDGDWSPRGDAEAAAAGTPPGNSRAATSRPTPTSPRAPIARPTTGEGREAVTAACSARSRLARSPAPPEWLSVRVSGSETAWHDPKTGSGKRRRAAPSRRSCRRP